MVLLTGGSTTNYHVIFQTIYSLFVLYCKDTGKCLPVVVGLCCSVYLWKGQAELAVSLMGEALVIVRGFSL